MEYWKRMKEQLLFLVTTTPVLHYSSTPMFFLDSAVGALKADSHP